MEIAGFYSARIRFCRGFNKSPCTHAAQRLAKSLGMVDFYNAK